MSCRPTSVLRPIPELAPLDVAEIDDVPIDYRGYTQPTEIITAIAVTATVEVGTDPGAQELINGQCTIGTLNADGKFVADPLGHMALQSLKGVGRPVGTKYNIRAVATLNSGRQLTAAAYITVVQV